MTDNVHVVTVDYDSQSVLGRLVRPLVREYGWSYGPRVRPSADVNYFFPYLQIEGKSLQQERTAAFFTHRDVGRREKEQLWDQANAHVELRVVTTSRYAAILHHPQLRVTHPIDLDLFTPRGRPSLGRVGTSGYTYPGGRKGERLWGQLGAWNEREDQGLRLVATGRGWPGVCTEWEWERMPDFYRSLHVYVCTSTIEGFGCGPVEALACGTPVVVPVGVGVFDELGVGAYGYEPGSLPSLVAALKDAFLCEATQEEMRAGVSKYTYSAWVAGHEVMK